jgi:hypothetical protein
VFVCGLARPVAEQVGRVFFKHFKQVFLTGTSISDLYVRVNLDTVHYRCESRAENLQARLHAAPAYSACMAPPRSHINRNTNSCNLHILKSRQFVDCGHFPRHLHLRACFCTSSRQRSSAFPRQVKACCRFAEGGSCCMDRPAVCM